MSFSSGAYFGSHSDGKPISGGQSGPRGFAGMDRAVVENQDDGFVRAARARPVDRVEAAEEGDEVAAALGGAGIDDQLVSGAVEGADHRPLLGLPRRLDAQVAAAFGPGVGKIGMGGVLPNSSPATEGDIRLLACCFSRRRRRPERSTASASCRPFSVCRGRRQAKPPFCASPR